MYKLGTMSFSQTKPSCVIRLSDNAAIPFDPDNTDYQAFTRWLNDGNIPLPADEGVNNGEINT
jgi:hypothetical protein